MDLTEAEAVMDIIGAQTGLALKAAQEQLGGGISRRAEELRRELLGIVAHAEAYIDFPEEDIDPETGAALVDRLRKLDEGISGLLKGAGQGRILREGARVVIVGPPNAGKSSLLNILLGFDRAIVSKTAGTTRDTIEEAVNIDGVPVRFVDTAGLRESSDEIEREGIDRSRAALIGADLAILVVDASGAPDEDMISVPDSLPLIRLHNKMDLGLHSERLGTDGIPFSCLRGEGIEILKTAVVEKILGSGFDRTAELVAINARHQDCLEKARQSCAAARQMLEDFGEPEFVALHLREALDHVGDITGKTDVEEILGEIFASFCVGK